MGWLSVICARIFSRSWVSRWTAAAWVSVASRKTLRACFALLSECKSRCRSSIFSGVHMSANLRLSLISQFARMLLSISISGTRASGRSSGTGICQSEPCWTGSRYASFGCLAYASILPVSTARMSLSTAHTSSLAIGSASSTINSRCASRLVLSASVRTSANLLTMSRRKCVVCKASFLERARFANNRLFSSPVKSCFSRFRFLSACFF